MDFFLFWGELLDFGILEIGALVWGIDEEKVVDLSEMAFSRVWGFHLATWPFSWPMLGVFPRDSLLPNIWLYKPVALSKIQADLDTSVPIEFVYLLPVKPFEREVSTNASTRNLVLTFGFISTNPKAKNGFLLLCGECQSNGPLGGLVRDMVTHMCMPQSLRYSRPSHRNTDWRPPKIDFRMISRQPIVGILPK